MLEPPLLCLYLKYLTLCSLAAREWAVISITPKGSNFSCPELTNEVAETVLGAVDQVSSCHRQSHTILDRVWRDGYTGVIHAEIVRTLPPPFMDFNPLVNAMREQSPVREQRNTNDK